MVPMLDQIRAIVVTTAPRWQPLMATIPAEAALRSPSESAGSANRHWRCRMPPRYAAIRHDSAVRHDSANGRRT